MTVCLTTKGYISRLAADSYEECDPRPSSSLELRGRRATPVVGARMSACLQISQQCPSPGNHHEGRPAMMSSTLAVRPGSGRSQTPALEMPMRTPKILRATADHTSFQLFGEPLDVGMIVHNHVLNQQTHLHVRKQCQQRLQELGELNEEWPWPSPVACHRGCYPGVRSSCLDDVAPTPGRPAQ